MPPGEKPAVLVVDDDADVREALQDTLEQSGHRVATAGDGTEALAFLEANPLPAMILLDWNMAPMNAEGFMAAFAKQPRFQHIPVVLVTADVRANELGKGAFAATLKKPIRLESLFEMLARFGGGV